MMSNWKKKRKSAYKKYAHICVKILARLSPTPSGRVYAHGEMWKKKKHLNGEKKKDSRKNKCLSTPQDLGLSM